MIDQNHSLLLVSPLLRGLKTNHISTNISPTAPRQKDTKPAFQPSSIRMPAIPPDSPQKSAADATSMMPEFVMLRSTSVEMLNEPKVLNLEDRNEIFKWCLGIELPV